MADLLIELGCEELPASSVERALAQFRAEIESRLTACGIEYVDCESLATPRRLILSLTGLPQKQPDQSKEVRGPSVKAAFNADGAAQGPLIGFCKSQGAELSEVRNDGEYIWITKNTPGQFVSEVLSAIIPESILAINFDKSMRWGHSRIRFARPIRWILALLDGAVVPCAIEDVHSGNLSRGHRFNFPEEFVVIDFNHLVNELRKRQVEPDAAVRRDIIVKKSLEIASGVPEMSASLIDENTYLTEWPMPLEGAFAEEYLVLPDPVLVTAMAKHERFFPIRDTDGKITNKFISIRNGGEEDTVRKGNAWVLSARYNDAKFFFDEDANSTLDQFLEMTTRMTFQEKLGSVRSRTNRLVKLAEFLADQPFFESEKQDAHMAAKYAKADLSTGLVGELSSLQGIVGGIYAQKEGHNAVVCKAISDQYAHDSIEPARNKSDQVSAAVIIADQVDKLVGYLGIKQIPSGSSDPYGLRKAITILIEIAQKWPAFKDLGYLPIFKKAAEFYAADGVVLDETAWLNATKEIFAARYEALLVDVRYDVLVSALAGTTESELMNPEIIRFKAETLSLGAADKAFVQTATRPINLIRSAISKGIFKPSIAEISDSVLVASLESQQGADLLESLVAAQNSSQIALQNSDAKALFDSFKGLEQPLNDFFETTMVMVDDEKVRDARLTMISKIANVLETAGDWSKIVQDA